MKVNPPSTVAFVFFFNDTATTEIYTLSLHDALPISARDVPVRRVHGAGQPVGPVRDLGAVRDRKSTRLNSSHSQISYAVFCLKKKKNLLPFILHHLYIPLDYVNTRALHL